MAALLGALALLQAAQHLEAGSSGLPSLRDEAARLEAALGLSVSGAPPAGQRCHGMR